MAKNVTCGYFDRKKPDHTTYATPNWSVPDGRIPISRLSWLRSEAPITWDAVTKLISDSALTDSTFFIDSSFLDRHEMPPALWEALLAKKIVFTPGVWAELKDWLENPFANRPIRDLIASARDQGHQSFSFLPTSTWSDSVRKSAEYYISLLACRKRMAAILNHKFATKHNRELTPEELKSQLQSAVRDRGIFLATKGLADTSKPNFLTDEELVVTAVFHAILTGSETTILTRDKDILEQFYKAIYLLDTHYRSRLIHNSFHDCPENIVTVELSDDALPSEVVDSPATVLMLPRRFAAWVLPTDWSFVNIYCNRFGGVGDQMKMSHLTFSAEKEMAIVLNEKGESGGKNTPAQSERNCTMLISPPFPEGVGGNAILAKDRLSSVGDFVVPTIDLNYSVMEIERFSHLSPINEQDIEDRSLGLALASFRVGERFQFSLPKRELIHVDEIATALKYFDSAAILFPDLGFLDTNHLPGMDLAVQGREFLLTKHVSDLIAARPATDSASPLSTYIRRGGRNIGICDTSDSAVFAWGFGHYLALLAFRKQFGEVIAGDLERDTGRKHTFDECKPRLEEVCGTSGALLAEAGHVRRNDPGLFFSEEVIVQGLLTALECGTDILFLTHDPLFMNQVSKLFEMVAADYASFRYATFANEALDVHAKQLRSADSESGRIFETNSVLCRLEEDWHTAALPKKPYLLNLHCWLLDGPCQDSVGLTATSFCIERPMHELLQVKARCRGANADRTDRINLRISYAAPNRVAPQAMIARDRIVALGSRCFPTDKRLDLRIDGMPALDLMNAVRLQSGSGSFI
jgi:hypothetical protein